MKTFRIGDTIKLLSQENGLHTIKKLAH